MMRYAKAITAVVSLLVAFALYGPEGKTGEGLYNEIELVVSAIVPLLVFIVPNIPSGRDRF